MNTPQRICFFLGTVSGKGGTERVCIDLANYLVENGYEISIVSLYKGTSSFFELNTNINLLELYPEDGKFLYKYPEVILRLRKILSKIQPHVLVTVESILGMYSVPACFGKRIFHIGWEHFNYEVTFGLRVRKVARWMLARFASTVVVLTKKDKDLWDKALGCGHKVICIPNPAMYEQVVVAPYEKRELVVLAVGRLTYQKGFDLLMDAWERVIPSHPEWKLIVCGDGEDEQVLKAKAAQMITAGYVQFIPANLNVQAYYNQASIYCMSSRFEGLPMVLIEAQTFGLPIVSFDCNTGPSEVISHGVNGYLCKPEDVNDLAAQLSSLMSDALSRAAFSQNAIASAQRFNKRSIRESWLHLFNNVHSRYLAKV